MKAMVKEQKGYWALVLHAHLPYVRHPELPQFLEERWLFEALTECYLPLTESWLRLREEKVDFCVTLSVTPSLAAMLTDNLLQQRYREHLDKMLQLAALEEKRTAEDEDFALLAALYRRKLEGARRLFQDEWNSQITEAWKSLAQSGHLDLWTSAATHGFLPYLTESSWTPQIRTGVRQHKAIFGMEPHGLWLPECAYAPGLEKVLAQEGVYCFVVDTGTFRNAHPGPANLYQPLDVGAQVSAFARDPETSHQVWDKKSGYPGDYDYREFYRDIGYDLPFETVAPFLSGPDPGDTGFKYYRITGDTDQKEAYCHDRAMEKVNAHADNFVFNREAQTTYWRDQMDLPPIVVSPYDGELFGHWWYEGPDFLEAVLRRLASPETTVQMTTPRRYRETYGPGPSGPIAFSTWGEDGYGKVWLNPANDWIYRHLHRAEAEMVALAKAFPQAQPEIKKALHQAARELLLAQSSDWPFIMHTGTTVEYATGRLEEHLQLFWKLARSLRSGQVDETALSEAEWKHPIFRDIDYCDFAGVPEPEGKSVLSQKGSKPIGPIWMLSWEYPPRVVGGLGRAVADLSKALAARGVPVKVFTCAVPGCPDREVIDGVTVIRLPVPGTASDDFLGWVWRFNFALLSGVIAESASEKPALIHGHDWMVGMAAKEIRRLLQVPLVVTIHATEHGRQRGIWNDLQRSIHNEETDLSNAADALIACSNYMAKEITTIFSTPWAEIAVLPNGVDPANLMAKPGKGYGMEKFCGPGDETIFYVGRLVPEKGVQWLVEAMPNILSQRPQARLIIAGKGPMMEELKEKALALAVEHRVSFAGFVDDDSRNRLISSAQIAVFPSLYEPFGIVALEAMAANTPVIVSDTGGLGEIIRTGENGIKVPPGDVQKLAEAVIAMLQDREGANKMAEAARQDVDQIYSWDVIAEETIKTYQRAILSFGTFGFLAVEPADEMVG
ncbi:DUF1957 domain-containing protein [Heliobacterium chlorum]|uniref:DUF1957 domain-containing protein n=1 Tax=Heliobacterium chlorum TaxID=2698 RepID=A0ABR7SYZ0_HELCL|nr:1,4-alpha-glucan branching protein domain-containing protein [Heliobacterium chlorum]MBC9783240.1 DUF1957 domain-containing protein [Heliobacterium chlorum]